MCSLCTAVPRTGRQSFPIQFAATPAASQLRAPAVQPSHLPADSATPGVTRGMTPVTAVTGPPVETPVPWEYPTGVWALLPWSGRPMTPHCGMRRPGAGGRSFTSPFEPRVRGQYGSPSGRHDLSPRVGRHTPSAVAAHPSHEETTSHELLPPLCPAYGRHQAHPPLPHPVKHHHP